MAVQLPDDLVVAAGGIEIGDVGPEQERRAAIVNRIVMPVDDRARAKREIAIAEQIVAAGDDPLSAERGIR